MMTNIQKLSIRLLRNGLQPEHAVRANVDLLPWGKIEGALIALETLGKEAPKWANFLELSAEQRSRVFNRSAVGLVFLKASDRWFAVSFGLGHVKLEPDAFEQDFGLRVVLNAVHPDQIKSADIRTPDENTVSRRTQTSRGSDQTAFKIDAERDLVRGLAGAPKDPAFGTYACGSDGLTLNRRLNADALPQACSDALTMYGKLDYKAAFGWIDQVRHIRNQVQIERLDAELAKAIAAYADGDQSLDLHLAFPVIYDPETHFCIRYKGFGSKEVYPDLQLSDYVLSLKKRRNPDYTLTDLQQHKVHQVSDDGTDCGGKWSIRDCLVFEVEIDGLLYVLSGGRWYQVNQDLAKEVRAFFEGVPQFELPEAEASENEERYNSRIAARHADEMICLDRQLIKPTNASHGIEVCDFLSKQGHIIHIKDKTSSSRLSHLFNQGTVSARVLLDGRSRKLLADKVALVQSGTGQSGYERIVPQLDDEFSRDALTVVFGVITDAKRPKLPFFSLVTFRQAANELRALGYRYEFSWIRKPRLESGGMASQPGSTNEEDELIEA